MPKLHSFLVFPVGNENIVYMILGFPGKNFGNFLDVENVICICFSLSEYCSTSKLKNNVLVMF